MTPRRIVIVGAGESGARVAIALREQGFDGAVTPLSKGALFGEDAPALAIIGDAQRFDDLGVDMVFGVAATAIDRAAHRLRLSDGAEIGFDQLVLATGARPRRLTLPGGERGFTLRSFEDAVALRRRMRPGAAIVVIGGGFIGLELAAGARKRGCEVVVVEAAPRILAPRRGRRNSHRRRRARLQRR
jgi:3-phenylpropionate/trans-cinnamate dioxygenase ferredoxin reductase subunit